MEGTKQLLIDSLSRRDAALNLLLSFLTAKLQMGGTKRCLLLRILLLVELIRLEMMAEANPHKDMLV